MPHDPAGVAGTLGETVELESPPVKVAKGLATYTGLAAALAAAAPVVIDLLTREDLPPRLRHTLIIVAAGLAALVVVCRTAQAIVAELVRGRQAMPPVTEPAEWRDGRRR